MNEFVKLRLGRNTLWLADGEVASADYVYTTLAHRNFPNIRTWMRDQEPVQAAAIRMPVAILLHGRRVLGARVATWSGYRYGPLRAVRESLREEFSRKETQTLMDHAKVIYVGASKLKRARSLIGYGIRP